MPSTACENSDCTVGTTGTCLLSHASPAECPHFHDMAVDAEISELPVTPTPTVQVEESRGFRVARTFHAGIELGLSDAAALMGARYGHIFGVLGTTGVGKTTFLTSLYLMASRGTLSDEYLFAGSSTLQGFEDRARGLREWGDGVLHEHLADHTILSDPRQPGLLHLALQESDHARQRFDLLLTDLPGEWTEHLIHDSAYASRLDFLRRADGIILVVDGPALLSPARHAELQNMRHLGDRLVTDVGVPEDTPVVVVVSKGDEIDMSEPAAANELVEYFRELGLNTTLVLSAAVSRTPDTVPNGTGVFEAVRVLISSVPSSTDVARSATVNAAGRRRFQTFKHRM